MNMECDLKCRYTAAGLLPRHVSKRGADGYHKPVRQRGHARHLPASNGSGFVSNLGMVGSFTS